MSVTTPVRSRRRTVLRSAAWSIPVVSLAAAAPAYALSTCAGAAVCPSLAFGAVSGTANTNGMNGGGFPAAGNAWSATTATGWSNGNAIGFQSTGASSSRFAATSEPTTAGRTITLTQTGQPPLQLGCSYQLQFGIIQFIGVAAQLELYLTVGVTAYLIYTTAGKTVTNSNVDVGIQTFNVPATASGTVGFRFNFLAAGGSNDLTLYTPSMTCLNTS